MLIGTDFDDYLKANYAMKQLPFAANMNKKLRIGMYNFLFQQYQIEREQKAAKYIPKKRKMEAQQLVNEIQAAFDEFGNTSVYFETLS